MNEAYRKQVSLLLKILPEIALEDKFALHGGTAINLFHQNMPRLSVDIDLTYVPYSNDREMDLQNIRLSLEKIKHQVKKKIRGLHFSDESRASEELKLICSTSEATVKIEVNQINRGLISKPKIMLLCDKAQDTFDSFCEMTIVSDEQLWGGKVIAALDRQHPRDLFDIKNLFTNINAISQIKPGILFFLLCSNRPMHELLNPNRSNQEHVFNSQFNGMTESPFNYTEYKLIRERLIKEVYSFLTANDKNFLYEFTAGRPIWDTVDYSMFPAIRWKLINIQKLKENKPYKHKEQLQILENLLS